MAEFDDWVELGDQLPGLIDDDPLKTACMIVRFLVDDISTLSHDLGDNEDCFNAMTRLSPYLRSLFHYLNSGVDKILAEANDYPAKIGEQLYESYAVGIKWAALSVSGRMADILRPDIKNRLLRGLANFEVHEVEKNFKVLCGSLEIAKAANELMSRCSYEYLRLHVEKEYQRAKRIDPTSINTAPRIAVDLVKQALGLYNILELSKGHWVNYDDLIERWKPWQESQPVDSSIQRGLKRLARELQQERESISIDHKNRRAKLDK